MKPIQVILHAVILLMIVGLVSQSAAQSPLVQPTAGEPEKELADTSSVTTQSIGGMIVSGGTMNIIFFGILGLFSLCAVTVVLERIVNLRRNKLLPESFLSVVQRAIENHASPSELQRICSQQDHAASRILQSGLLRSGRPLPEVEKAMEDSAAREMAAMRGKSRPLSVVGNVAPLVGLLGTVVGMIMAFQISSQEGLGKAERLAEGIYLALMTTAAGLTIAIPCLLFASWFHSKAERYMCDISECLSRTMPTFAKLEGQSITLTPMNKAPMPVSSHEELSAGERFLREGEVKVSRG
jgi:biopolymer transport protein ExbB